MSGIDSYDVEFIGSPIPIISVLVHLCQLVADTRCQLVSFVVLLIVLVTV